MKDSLKNTICQILQRLGVISDWVVEQGTSGIWTYRKWNSGIAECWGNASSLPVAQTTSGNMYRYTFSAGINFPFTFISAPIVTAVPNSESFYYYSSIISLQRNTSKITNVYFIRDTNAGTSNLNVDLQIHVYGLWKTFSGGVLRNTVIAILSAISKIGGGVNEGYLKDAGGFNPESRRFTSAGLSYGGGIYSYAEHIRRWVEPRHLQSLYGCRKDRGEYVRWHRVEWVHSNIHNSAEVQTSSRYLGFNDGKHRKRQRNMDGLSRENKINWGNYPEPIEWRNRNLVPSRIPHIAISERRWAA